MDSPLQLSVLTAATPSAPPSTPPVWSQEIHTATLAACRVAERTGRFADASSLGATLVRSVVYAGAAIDEETRVCVLAAFQGEAAQIRAGLKQCQNQLNASSNQSGAVAAASVDVFERYKTQLLRELATTCSRALDVVSLMLGAKSDDSGLIWGNKTAGDFHRYLAEATGSSEARAAAETAYAAALGDAQLRLPPTNLMRLALSLNLACLYECGEDFERAARTARDALDEVEAELSSPETNSHSAGSLGSEVDVKYVLELLRKVASNPSATGTAASATESGNAAGAGILY